MVASLQNSCGYERLGDSHRPGRGSEHPCAGRSCRLPGVTDGWLVHPSSSPVKVYSALWDCKVAPEVVGLFFSSQGGRKFLPPPSPSVFNHLPVSHIPKKSKRCMMVSDSS